MQSKFRKHSSIDYEISVIPDSKKEEMCLSLLTEFGAKIASISTKGEILHSCPLPFGQHKNGDRNPSAYLNYQKMVFHCWGCGNSGSLMWLVATCRNETSEEARDWLKSETGIGGEQSLSSLLEYFDAVWSPTHDTRPPLPKLDPQILDPWLAIHPYMTEKRGISEETLMRFRVGYNPNMRVKVGERYIDSERIVIPHFWKTNLVGWQSRRIFNDGTPKYLSSPEFPKDSSLFNYNPREPAIIVESPISVLAKDQQYSWHLEATFGASVTDRQIRLLAEHSKVILCFDNDTAGYNATNIVGNALMSYTDVFVWDNPYDADVADLDSQTYCNVLNHRVPFSVWRKPEVLLSQV